jgi:Glucodextranase, domain B/Bacterial Ig-like domain (group 2)/Beta-propeller repeat/PQQ-like domain
MTLKRLALTFCLLLISFSSHSQQTAVHEPRAIALAAGTLTVGTGGHWVNDVTLTKATISSTITKAELGRRYGAIPLGFETNEGQTDSEVEFASHSEGYTIFLAHGEAILALEQRDEAVQNLEKMDRKVRRHFESRKFYHASPRFRKVRQTEIVGIALEGANPTASVQPLEELPGLSNYFIGNDPKKWRTGIPTYTRVKYTGIYPGTDLIYYGNHKKLEFDFIVAPGANPNVIRLHVKAKGRLVITKDGRLEVGTLGGSFELHNPEIYQLEGSKRKPVDGGFVLRGDHEVGFQLAGYDRSKALIIDPTLSYSTYVGGSGSDFAEGLAVDSLGNAYITGFTSSTNFPTLNGYPAAANSNDIAFVSKLNPTGTALLYSTYLGGTGGEFGTGIALDLSGNVYVCGSTFSSDFPLVNAYQTSLGSSNGNAFVAKINTTQSGTSSLVYSTFLGGGGNTTNSIGDQAFGIAADASGLAYVTGQTVSDASTAPFPTSSGAYQSSLANPNGNAFLTVLDTNRSGAASLAYSTYLGGDSSGFGDFGMGVTTDGLGNAYLTGQATSGGPSPFPTTPNAYQTSQNSANGNVFLTEIATTQAGSQSLIYSTYLGGSSTSIGDSGSGIALDSAGKVYIDGDTTSPDFPTTPGAFQTTNSAGGRAFTAKFDLTKAGVQSLVYSTYLGGTNGSEGEVANGVAVDANGNAFVSGSTSSTDFPVSADAFQSSVMNDMWNVYLTQMNPTGTGILYSTYLGGSCSAGFGDLGFGVVVDSLGNPYVDGSTCSTDFPTFPSSAYQTLLGGTYNGFVAKFALNPNPGITAALSPSPNYNGWNNSAVTVSFTCIPGGAPISNCSSPVTVSTQGASQVVSGTAIDTSANTATTSVTVNLDLTPPAVSITSPANGATVSAPYVVVSGSVTDALSGVGGVLCNGAPATVTSTSFSCTVILNSVSNSITVTGTDLAGNSTTSTITVSVSMAAPTSLQITPGPVTMLVGNTQSFAAIDQTGSRRPDAAWSVSNTAIATLATDGSGTLTGVAAGQVTLTATVGSISAQTQVTVLAASTLAPGTILWSATPIAGFTTQQIVQAVPTVNGPGLYSLETDSNANVLIRAFTSAGGQMWQQTPFSGTENLESAIIGDNNGGVLLNVLQETTSFPSILVDFNASTGTPMWQYTSPSRFGGAPAVRPDGTIVVIEFDPSGSGSSLITINGTTGEKLSSVQIPSSVGYPNNDVVCGSPSSLQGPVPSTTLGPIIDAAGNMYVLYWQYTESIDASCQIAEDGTTTVSGAISLLEVNPVGSISTQVLQAYSSSAVESGDSGSFTLTCSGVSPTLAGLIPDGQQGVLASWAAGGGTGACVPSTVPPFNIVDVSAQGMNAYQIPMTEYSINGYPMVLGQAGVAFVVNGHLNPFGLGTTPSVVSFNVSSGQVLWSYSGSAGGQLSLIEATSDGGASIDDSQRGVLQLDSHGNASQPVTSLEGSVPFSLFSWAGISGSGLADMIWNPDGANGITSTLATSLWPEGSGDDQHQNAAPRCQVITCVLTPTFDDLVDSGGSVGVKVRELEYTVYSLGQGILNPLGRGQVALNEDRISGTGVICDFPSNVCSKDQGQLDDNLSAGNTGVTVTTQTFFVDRGQVRVFWPRTVFNKSGQQSLIWYGALSQTASTFPAGPTIQQINPDLQHGASCSSGCDPTGPAGP